MPETVKRPRSNRPTTPEDFPTTAPLPSGDYSYTVEIVMGLQRSIGQLTEAVNHLKEGFKEQKNELGKINQDIHTGKGMAKAFGIVLSAMGAIGLLLLGSILTVLLKHFNLI